MIWNKSDESLDFGTEELRDVLEDYVGTTESLLEALHVSSDAQPTLEWRPHLPQMHAALAHFRDLCREEIENAKSGRAFSRDAAEVHEAVWNEGERLVNWLNRMLGLS